MSDADGDAGLAAALLAVDPGLGGAVLRGRAGPARDAWTSLLRRLAPPDAPWRRVPLQAGEDRLFGGLDLAATLTTGRPVTARGLFAESRGGTVLAACAERLPVATAARIAALLDDATADVAVVALDEGVDEEAVPSALADRLALYVAIDHLPPASPATAPRPAQVAAARACLAAVTTPEAAIADLCAVAARLGIVSLRAPLHALRTARAAAALAGRGHVAEDDLSVAVRLVLVPRARQMPAPQNATQDDPGDTPQEPGEPPETAPEPSAQETQPPPPAPAPAGDDAPAPEQEAESDASGAGDRLLEAARAALPPGLLEALALTAGAKLRTPAHGVGGASGRSPVRGRPVGVRRGELRGGARLALVETLRAAAPWQPLRRAALAPGRVAPPVLVRPDDVRLRRFVQRTGTVTVFAVDASGSAALHRLAEAKGAVQLLLADCYVRRDQVALVAFRGTAAELLLPPTRSLARASRCLSGLPGGGGTPLAAGIDAAGAVADAARRRGLTPLVVLLTDGRANVGRDGRGGRPRAAEEALAAGRMLRAAGTRALLIDTSPQPYAPARGLADAMGARYCALPAASAAAVSRVVRAAAGAGP